MTDEEYKQLLDLIADEVNVKEIEAYTLDGRKFNYNRKTREIIIKN